MNAPTQRVTTLELVNYEASLAIAKVTPGLELCLRDNVIITSSQVFPTKDTSHACLIRTAPHTANQLIDEIIDYFRSRGLPPVVFVSPACTPADLPKRLLTRGFVPDQAEEAWLVFEKLQSLQSPAVAPSITVTQVGPAEGPLFAATFGRAFDLPLEVIPLMTELMAPSIGLPGVYHFLAWVHDQPIATLSLICYHQFGIIGSAGVVPAFRGGRAASKLAITAARLAQAQAVDSLILQTTAGTLFERFLRISGFARVFTRRCYTLP